MLRFCHVRCNTAYYVDYAPDLDRHELPAITTENRHSCSHANVQDVCTNDIAKGLHFSQGYLSVGLLLLSSRSRSPTVGAMTPMRVKTSIISPPESLSSPYLLHDMYNIERTLVPLD